MVNFVCNKCGKNDFKDKYAYTRHMNRKTSCIKGNNKKTKLQNNTDAGTPNNNQHNLNNQGIPHMPGMENMPPIPNMPNTFFGNNEFTPQDSNTTNTINTNSVNPINITAGENPEPKLTGVPGLDFIGTVPGLEGVAKMLGVPVNVNPNCSLNHNPAIKVKFDMGSSKSDKQTDNSSLLELSKKMLFKQLCRGEVNIRPLPIHLEKFLDSKMGSEDDQETIKFNGDPMVEVIDILSYYEPDIKPDSPIFGKEMTRRDNYLIKSMNFITKRLFKHMIMQDPEPFRGINIVVDDDSILMLNNAICLYKNLLDMINYQNATRELNLELKKYEVKRHLESEDDCLTNKMETLLGDIVLSQYECVSDFLFDFEHMILESRKRPDHDYPGFKPLLDEELNEMDLVYKSLKLNKEQINYLNNHFQTEREVHQDYEESVMMPPHPKRPIRKSRHTEILEQKRLKEEEEERIYQEELAEEAKKLGITTQELEDKRERERKERLDRLREAHKRRLQERENQHQDEKQEKENKTTKDKTTKDKKTKDKKTKDKTTKDKKTKDKKQKTEKKTTKSSNKGKKAKKDA